jgi:DNA-directed RNA polymerase subunit RPC12/RpoP
MTELAGYKCRRCHNEFVIELLTNREAEQYRRERRQTSPVICPQCNGTQLERKR